MAELTETVYEHISGEATFTITAAEKWSKNMTHRLKKKYPDEVDIRVLNPDGSMVVRFPFSWMRIKPKAKRNMSETERKQKRELMLSLTQLNNEKKDKETDA